jgi:hypothetical protein
MKKITFCLSVLWGTQALAQTPADTSGKETKVTIVIKSTRRDTVRNPADTVTIITRRRVKRLDNEWVLDVGINNFLEKGAFPDGKPYAVKNGLDYVAITTSIVTHIGGSKNPFFFHSGLEISWNALMFEEQKRIARGADRVELEQLKDAQGNNIGLRKSKLGITYLSIPLMLEFNPGRAGKSKGFHAGIGGYVGVKLKSWSKVKFDDSKKERVVDGFYLNTLRYGVMGEVGYSWMTLFAKYDLNPLFRSGKSFDPNSDLNVLNIGLRF